LPSLASQAAPSEVAAVTLDPLTSPVLTTALPETREETRTKLLPPYHVILENDDHHSFEFVVSVLRKVLGCSHEEALQLTWTAHSTGRAVVWTGPKEVAELKVEQIRTFHETRAWDNAQLGPLTCYLEPAPGG
jgi:ATP-dependent Clp protease adaptor protein ClpS